jgi:hypothetical protein
VTHDPLSDDPAWAPPGAPPPVSAPPPAWAAPSQPGYQVSVPPGYPGAAPPAGYPYVPPPPLPPQLPPGVPRLRPVRIDPVPGTPFGIAIPALNPTVSGLAVGSLVAGIGSILVSVLVVCSGLGRSSSGALVGGAFAVLAILVGLGSMGAAFAALREIRASAGQIRGRGLAIAGLSCGATGVGVALLGMLFAVALAV